MAELKPCPFCGGEAVKQQWTDWAYRVICLKCCAYGPRRAPEISMASADQEAEAASIAAWNTRAALKETPDET